MKWLTNNRQVYEMPLEQALSKHTKEQLLDICRDEGITGVSRLRKGELIQKLTEDLPIITAKKMLHWDQPTYDLMEYMAKEEEPIYPFDPEDLDDVEEYFLDGSIGFPFHMIKGGFGLDTLIVPLEFQEVFLHLDGTRYKNVVQANTAIARFAKGLLYYYGYLGLNEMVHFLNAFSEGPLNKEYILGTLLEVAPYNWDIYYDDEGFADGRILDLSYLLKERNKRPDLEYRKLSSQQVWEAGDPFFHESSAELRSIADFCRRRGAEDEIEELLGALFSLIQSKLLPPEIVPGVASLLNLESAGEIEELASLIFTYYNATPLWVLKGHTPAQLGPEPKGQVYDFTTKKKVGRNEPCPCGSGRKYKRCCGSN